jgi:hypothetical protein
MSWNITGAPGTGEDLLYSQAGTPTLDLRFASSKNLNDYVSGQNLIDFTRGGNGIGSYFDAAGTLRQSVVNLLQRSEEFDQSPWGVFLGATIATNQAIAPNGTKTAELLTLSSSNRFTGVRQAITLLPSTTYTLSWWVRSVTGTAPFCLKIFDGVADTFSPNLTATNSWQRFSLTVTTAAGADGGNLQIANITSPLQTQELYIWGAQLEQSSTVGEYVKTTSSISGAPRFDHNPATGESLGLLIEEARTNLLLNSETLATQSVTVTAAAHTLSFYGTGTVTLSGTHSATVVGTGAFPTRTTLTFTPTSGSLTVTVSGTVQYAQVELGAFATSWISTAGATATRNADVASITGTNFLRWYSQSAGTVFADATGLGSSVPGSYFQSLAAFSDGANATRIELGYLTASAALLDLRISNVLSVSLVPAVSSNRRKLIGSFDSSGAEISVNGEAPITDLTVVMPTVNKLDIGGANNAGIKVFHGHIRRLTYFDRRLPNATLQAITA